MANFFDQIGQIGKDLAGSITGSTDANLYKQQLAQQQALNQQIFDLEKERLALQQTPEYQAQKRNKLIATVVILLAAMILAFFLLRD